MNQEIFQQKLKDLVTLANQNHKQLHQQVARQFFQEDGLSDQQLSLVLEYLRSQGIRVTGMPEGDEAKPASLTFAPKADSDSSSHSEEAAQNVSPNQETPAALSPEDTQALEEYRAHFFSQPQPSPEEVSRLFAAASAREGGALQQLAELYLPVVVELCAQLPGDIPLQDKVQEGSLGLWAALEAGLPASGQDQYLREAISRSVSRLLQEESQQKLQDNYLVERVRSLEAKVRELTEDSEVKFSVEELSAFLDMEVEEIQAILKLTGED